MSTSASASERLAERRSDMIIDGHWHAANHAARQPSRLTVTRRDDGLSLCVATPDGDVLLRSREPASISERVGNIERRLTFTDGSVFATFDNQAIDDAFPKRDRTARWVHALESSMPMIMVAIVCTALFVVAFVRYGIPFISERVAHALPQRAGDIISSSTLEFLDGWAFEPSTLDEASQAAIRTRMRERLLPLDERNDAVDYRLHFRDLTVGDTPIANALALPSGDIVLTDAFVELCDTDDEMDAVILHEIGHIVERHSLQRVVEATVIGSITMLVTGDSGVLADMGVGLGSILVSSHYSRRHEAAADRYAFERMLQARIDPTAFADIMGKLSDSLDAEQDVDKPLDDEGQGTVLDFLASHPGSRERIEQAGRYAECYRRGELHCVID